MSHSITKLLCKPQNFRVEWRWRLKDDNTKECIDKFIGSPRKRLSMNEQINRTSLSPGSVADMDVGVR